MGRRASSSLNTAAIVGIIAVLAIAVGLGTLLLRKKEESFRDVAPLRVSEALENGNSLRGNEYRVEGKVLSRWVRDSGEAIELLIEDSGQQEHLPIMIPPGVTTLNIEREQRYALKIKFGEGGVAIATAIKKL